MSPSLRDARITRQTSALGVFARLGNSLRPLGSQEYFLPISGRTRCLEGDSEVLEPYLAAEGSHWMFRHCIMTSLCSGNWRPCVARFLCADARAHGRMHRLEYRIDSGKGPIIKSSLIFIDVCLGVSKKEYAKNKQLINQVATRTFFFSLLRGADCLTFALRSDDRGIAGIKSNQITPCLEKNARG